MNNPLVSIITPCYNSEKYIERYLDCLANQTYTKIQLIIVNDGSTDRTEELILSHKDYLESRGLSVEYIYQENKGLGGAINTGLKLIKGEFFTWCDSDNLLTTDYFEEKVEFFKKNTEAAIVRCDGYNVYDSDITTPISRLSDGNLEKEKKDLFYNCLTCKNFYFGCTMLRTSAFDKVNPQREIYPSREGQNWQIMLPMFYYYEAYYIDKPMFYFVIRDDSISHIAKQRGAAALIKQNDECEKIEITTIKHMNIPEEKKCLEIIQKQYAYIRFWIGDKYRDLSIMRKEYQKIRENKWETPAIDKAYRRCRSSLWRLASSIKEHLKDNR